MGIYTYTLKEKILKESFLKAKCFVQHMRYHALTVFKYIREPLAYDLKTPMLVIVNSICIFSLVVRYEFDIIKYYYN